MGREDPLPGDWVRVSPNPRRISRMVRLQPRFVMLQSPVRVRQSRFSPQISSKNPDSRSSLMTVTQSQEFVDVFNRVKDWPLDMRITLARRILETAETPPIAEPPRALSLDQVIG